MKSNLKFQLKNCRHFGHALVVLASTTALVLVGCEKKPTLQEKLGGQPVGIFSNRPQTQTHTIALIKLSQPALLATAVMKDGKRVIDAEAREQVLAEQEALIAALKGLSSEIRVLYRYSNVINGVAVVAPLSVLEKIRLLANVAYVEREGSFGMPRVQQVPGSSIIAGSPANSVNFIGADKVHALKVKTAAGDEVEVNGAGIKVGIIDTGIDYTHAMFNGAGTEEAFKQVNPDVADPGFPTAKVVGGIDLVGTEYNSGSADFSKRIPIPDENPLDQGGHGSHVAGTVAGFGDGVNTYSGVAPMADLYAIKVFGADGSTGDAVVVAALEYAADPNRDGELSDQLDVVNLSLGSSYGNPHVLYGQAMRNLSVGGTVIVAAAGNEGNFDYIVGAPGSMDEAISVAASVDNGDHNWKFGAVKFLMPKAGEVLTEAVESAMTKPIQQAGDIQGKLVYIGLANAELSAEQKAALAGNVAFIDRGAVTFAEKIKRATEAGAIGVVVANHSPGNPFIMGGDGEFDVPAIMVSLELGKQIKEEMNTGDVLIKFQTPEKIEKPQLIDTLTDFSSAGPRPMDALFKPEISAPGAAVISAEIGSGNKGVKLSGTSMAAPHLAGVAALVRQFRADLSSEEIKSVLMGTSKTITDEGGTVYPLNRQGAGRVQAFQATQAVMVTSPTALSLGEVNAQKNKTFLKNITLKNISKVEQDFAIKLETQSPLVLLGPASVKLAPGESKTMALKIRLDLGKLSPEQREAKLLVLDGLVQFLADQKEAHRVPVLAVIKRISDIRASSLKVFSTTEADSADALATVEVENFGLHQGPVLLFNLLGQDSRKNDLRNDPFLSRDCDLQAVGYRVIRRNDAGKEVTLLQVAAKLYQAVTTWHSCELSVLIDQDGDHLAEQELAAMNLGSLRGVSTPQNEQKFASVLLDAPMMRELRLKYELNKDQKDNKEDYSSAVMDLRELQPFNNSTVMVVEADVTKLVRRGTGELAIKVASIFNEASVVEGDDFLNSANEWLPVSLQERDQGFQGLPESLNLEAGQKSTLEFTKGEGQHPLMLLFPQNRNVFSSVDLDPQAKILTPAFGN